MAGDAAADARIHEALQFMKGDYITMMRMNFSHFPQKANGEEMGF